MPSTAYSQAVSRPLYIGLPKGSVSVMLALEANCKNVIGIRILRIMIGKITQTGRIDTLRSTENRTNKHALAIKANAAALEYEAYSSRVASRLLKIARYRTVRSSEIQKATADRAISENAAIPKLFLW